MPTITGTSGNDTLIGTAADDRVLGFGGDDLLDGRSGRDTLYGAAGDDILVGGLGRDILSGGAGADVFRFDDRDAGDFTASLADVIRDFTSEDVLDLLAVDVDHLYGYGDEPDAGGLSYWQARGNTYVTWNTRGSLHDIELTGYTGDVLNHIRWYEDDYAADATTTGRIAAGQTRAGAIEGDGDEDWFRITLTAGQLYTFDLRGESSGAGTLLDPLVYLVDANGEYLDYDDDGGRGRDARLLYAPEISGTYYLSANGYETGTYRLGVTARAYVDDYAGDTSTTGRIAAGQTRAGEIGVPYDEDWFQIHLTAGKLYTIDLGGASSGAGTLPAPDLTLLDANGGYVSVDYDSGAPDPQLYYVPVYSGTYYVSARGFYDDENNTYAVGTYRLGVTARTYADDYADDTSTTGRIAAGQTRAGEIGVPYDEDWFRIKLTEGQLYTFDLRVESSGAGTLSDPYLYLFDASGRFVAYGDGSGTPDARLLYASETSGIFYVSTNGYGTGTYRLGVTARAYVDDYAGDTSTTGRIAAGQTRAGEIGVPYDEDWFRIRLAEGQLYKFDLRGESSGAGTLPYPFLTLFDVNGDSIPLDDALHYSPVYSGTYFLAARGSGGTGTYELSVSAGEDLAAGAETGDALQMF